MKSKILLIFILLLVCILFVNCTKNATKSDNEGTHGVSSRYMSYKGKIMCGYQGWFNCQGDGAGLGWKHYEKGGQFRPGFYTIDFWPDVTELDNDEKFRTEFVHDDNTWAYVYSSANEKSVKRHFKWMRDYGIDGVFVQRFVSNTKNPEKLRNLNVVIQNCLKGAEKYDRALSVMYDMSGCGHEVADFIKEDWIRLVDYYNITSRGKNQSYLYHNNKPLVAIWGAGFYDRKYSLEDIEEAIDFLKNDSIYGGCSVLLGIPTFWREQGRDCIDDPKFHDLLKKVDIIHTWNVGRYGTLEGVEAHRSVIEDDIKWCKENNIDFVPSVFPGFSWHNLKPESPLNKTPRLKGKFLWSQMYSAMSAGAEMIYVSMFDEVDEGTAIFKCTNNPPNGESQFCDYEGLPSDFYLKLTGEAGKMLRGEIPLDPNIPLETE